MKRRRVLSDERVTRLGSLCKHVWKKNSPSVLEKQNTEARRALSLHSPYTEKGVYWLYQLVAVTLFKTVEAKHKAQVFLLQCMVYMGWTFSQGNWDARKEYQKFCEYYEDDFPWEVGRA